MSEELRAALYGLNDDDYYAKIEFRGGRSEILTDPEDLKGLSRVLTPRAEGYRLLFFHPE